MISVLILSFEHSFARRLHDEYTVFNHVLQLRFNFLFPHGILLLDDYDHLFVPWKVFQSVVKF